MGLPDSRRPARQRVGLFLGLNLCKRGVLVQIAKIIECDVAECAYNNANQCHTPAVTIGGPTDHKCDSFCMSSNKGGFPDVTAVVGACKVAECTHNLDLECAAPGIKVGYVGHEIDCLTFTQG